jgi:drug/metabolite transporter (DMT)-like permease
VLLSTVPGAYAAILVKRDAGLVDTLVVAGGGMFSGGVSLLLLATFTEPLPRAGLPLSATVILAYTAFLSAASFSLWYWLLRHNPVSTISTVKVAIPIFGIALSAVFLGEILTPTRLAAGALVGLGLWLVLRGGGEGPAAA